MVRILTICGILLLMSSQLWGQSISGTVTDESTGEGLPGVNILVKGTSIGASTDQNGDYELNVESLQDTLVFSFIGYQTQEVPIDERETIDVTMVPQTLGGDEELVVVGYGSQEASQVTGAISSVSSSEIQEVPVVSAGQALQGRMAGVDVVSSGHAPGSGATIRIRGLNSINASNDPLYVIDGIPMSGGINDINPDIIESIEVLKDASATAIYGARGSNGVVLISTKRGAEGRTQIDFDSYVGISQVSNKVDVLNADQWVEYREASRRSEDLDVLLDPIEQQNYNEGNQVNWLDQVLRNGIQQRHSLSLSGGNENTQYSISTNYLNEEGIIHNSNYRRGSVQVNLDHEFNDRLQIGTSTILSTSKNNKINGWQVLGQAMQISPLGNMYDEDGAYRLFPTNEALLGNPLADLENEHNQTVRTRVFSSIYGELNITEGLSYRLNFGPDLTFGNDGRFIGSHTNTLQGAPNRASNSRSEVMAYTLDNIIKYTRDFNNSHSLDLTLLHSIQEHSVQSNWVEAMGLPSESMLWHNLSAGQSRTFDSDEQKWSILSYMGRINYAFKDKYLVTLTARRDGSSRFGDAQKFGVFPSVALGWRIGDENFMQDVSAISDLKLRVSYGSSGNTAISPYQSLGNLSNNSYMFGSDPALGFELNTLPNPDLKWEKSQTLNVGLDFGLFENRISGSAEYYQIDTEDLLLNQALPTSTGYDNILTNIGATRNKGVEFTLSTINVSSTTGFSWNTDINFGVNRNEIVGLYGDGEDDIGNNWFIGQPVNVHYDLVFDGIWQEDEAEEAAVYNREPGHIKVKDLNNDNQINAEDRAILGSSIPDWTGGINNSFKYKGIDLSIFINTRQNFMIDSEIHSLSSLSGRYNIPTFVNYYTPENPSNSYPRPVIQGDRNIDMEVLRYRDASFIRVKNINLGYTLPEDIVSGIGISSLRLYANALNPFTFTDYEGWDPEAGGNLSSYPSTKKLLFGINVSL